MSSPTSGIELTRENFDELATAAAMSCARGIRQEQTVTDVLDAGYLELSHKILRYGNNPFWGNNGNKVMPQRVIQYGARGLDRDSWLNLKKRLEKAGFKFVNIKMEAKDPEDVFRRVYLQYTGYKREASHEEE